ncbi:MAG: hypothetical protein JO056_00840 [Alphaproteobacteria bacterium]|nr:hypothetical protein [Alphaproteobacteria bacterium]
MNMLSRGRLSEGSIRTLWVISAATVFGAGIWSTHFVAMLAYKPGLPVGYDVSLTTVSIVMAIVVSAAGFFIALRTGMAALGTGISGAAIGAMHYTGMAALQGPFHQIWSSQYVVASVITGIVFAALAGHALVSFGKVAGHALAALLLTLGICGMHFTGMTALTLIPDPTIAFHGAVLDPASVIVAVAAVAILIVAVGFIGARLDSHLAKRDAREAERLRAYIAELETANSEVERTSGHLRSALAAAALANQTKAQFLATMSHELRTPLNAIIGFAEIMAQQTFGPLGNKNYVDYANDIRASGSHLLQLINDILDLSRLDADGAGLHEDTFEISTVIAETIRMVRGHIEKANLSIDQNVAPDLPSIRADHRRLRQVLINLLSNAIKFTTAGGQITVMADLRGPDLAVSVRDTGIGIAPSDIARVFERFTQVDNTMSRKYEGAGLGLAISRQLVEAHGGCLELVSASGEGTTATIIIPGERLDQRLGAVA